MKGLLLKDFYIMRRYFIPLISCGIMMSAGLLMESIDTYGFYSSIPSFIIVLIFYISDMGDVKCKWTCNYDILPVKHSAVVYVRYIEALVLSVVFSAIFYIPQLVQQNILGQNDFCESGITVILMVANALISLGLYFVVCSISEKTVIGSIFVSILLLNPFFIIDTVCRIGRTYIISAVYLIFGIAVYIVTLLISLALFRRESR